MTPQENEQLMVEAFLGIADPQERLGVILSACAGPGLAEEFRTEMNLVGGCVSRVWIHGRTEAGRVVLAWDAESPVVRGLAGLVCGVYQNTAPAQAAAHECGILTSLRLDRALSPTRLRGLAALESRVRALAAGVH